MLAHAMAAVNFPVPFGPWNIQAWWTRFDCMDRLRMSRAWGWPMIEERGMGVG